MESPRYRARHPERGPLHQHLSAHLEPFLAQRAGAHRPLPPFITETLRAFLRCGLPEYGFARVYCRSCDLNRFVAFSCKKRGFCPSCGGRRSAQSAAHLRDNLFPRAPAR